MTSPLLTALRFQNGAIARNRLWLAPMTNMQSHEDGSLSDEELRWLLRRAAGGFGVIETCANHVAEDVKPGAVSSAYSRTASSRDCGDWPRKLQQAEHWGWCSCFTAVSGRIRSSRARRPGAPAPW